MARQQQNQRMGYMQSGAMQGGMAYNNMMRMPGGMPMKGDLQRQMAANRGNLYVTPYFFSKYMDDLGPLRQVNLTVYLPEPLNNYKTCMQPSSSK